MFSIHYRGQLIATFEERVHAHRYVHRLPYPVKVTDSAGAEIKFTGRVPTEVALRLAEIVKENSCTVAQARVILRHERATNAPAVYRAPGRPPTEVAARLDAIMVEQNCTRPQAQVLWNKERITGVPAKLRAPGRPTANSRIKEIMLEKNLPYLAARMQYSREISKLGRPSRWSYVTDDRTVEEIIAERVAQHEEAKRVEAERVAKAALAGKEEGCS